MNTINSDKAEQRAVNTVYIFVFMLFFKVLPRIRLDAFLALIAAIDNRAHSAPRCRAINRPVCSTTNQASLKWIKMTTGRHGALAVSPR